MDQDKITYMMRRARTDVSGKWISIDEAQRLVTQTVLDCAAQCDAQTAHKLLEQWGLQTPV